MWGGSPSYVYNAKKRVKCTSMLIVSEEPDLFIRTGGEKRISNYLLWHLAYTELYFSDVLYPDFNDSELDNALSFYAGRQRRFGRTGEQVTGKHA